MWYVYIARAHTGRYLVYASPLFINKSEARIRELQLKGWSRAKKEMFIQGKWE